MVKVASRNFHSSKIMKTYNNLWEKFISKENFELAYKNAIKHKSKQKQIIKFNQNAEENLEDVRQLVISGNFHTSKYRTKTIYEPKERVIYILPFAPDRIVQHAIINILKPILTNLFIENSYACIEDRGQMRASIKCSEYVRKYKYCLKCDIHHFYPSINQRILSNKFHRIIKDKKFMRIIDDVIFSFEGGYNTPIGNFCSQWFGNFYLSNLDNFILHKLKCGAYERYCDDFMLFSNDKTYLHYCRKQIEKYLENELELEFSKAYVFDTKQGVDYCGYRSFGKYVLVRKSSAKRFKKRFIEIEKEIRSNNYDIDSMQSRVSSTDGWIKHACAHHLKQKLKIEELLSIINERRKHEVQSKFR